jgi:ADP-heptose:LPS heptosyltransferase
MVLIWGPSERGLCEDIIRQSALPESALRLAPATTLRQLAALLGESALLVAGDTGPMHLAAALGRPVVAVYGASDGERNGPWGEGHVVLRAENADCAPCWKTECREGGLCRCMTDIRPERVAEAVLRLLERGDADPSRPVSVA